MGMRQGSKSNVCQRTQHDNTSTRLVLVCPRVVCVYASGSVVANA